MKFFIDTANINEIREAQKRIELLVDKIKK